MLFGGARVVGVRPDRIIGFASADYAMESLERYAARLGVPADAL